MGRHSSHTKRILVQSKTVSDNRRRMTTVAIAAICVAAIALVVAGSAIAIVETRSRQVPEAPASAAVAGVSGKHVMPKHDALERKDAPKVDEHRAQSAERKTLLDAMQSQLSEKTAQYQGSWQVYVEDFDSGATVVVNSHQSYSASVIKLMVMLAVFQKVSDGALEDDASLDGLLEQMITVSSNEATNSLVERLGSGNANAGFGVVNETAKRYGFGESHLNSRMGDLSDYSTKQTSASDQGRFLAAAYRGQLVSAEYSKRMIDIMSRQTRRSKIPGGLPSGVSCSNKTGEAPGVENDSAIVYGEHPYVIAVMSSDVPDSSAAQSEIRDISSTVWASLR